LCQGKIDFPLTAIGKQQARDAAERLRRFTPINSIFTSTLGRALDTAQTIADILGCSRIVRLDGLQERGWGVLEGMPNVEMYAQEFRERQSDYTGVPTIEGLESLAAVKDRIVETFEHIHKESDDSIPIVISHGRLFFALCDLILVDPIKQIPNGTPLLCYPSKNSSSWQLVSL
jgi:broad specificity phosphatase PhoE